MRTSLDRMLVAFVLITGVLGALALPLVATIALALPEAAMSPPPTQSIYQKLGLLDGDVIIRVNGEPMDDPQAAHRALTGKIEEIEVTRNGERKILRFASPQPVGPR